MPVTIIFYFFYLEGHITRKFTLKKKKSMDNKLDTPSTLRHGLRDQNHFSTRLRRDVSQLSINASFFQISINRSRREIWISKIFLNFLHFIVNKGTTI